MKMDVAYVEAAGERYSNFASCVYLGGKISRIGCVISETHSHIGQAWTCFY